MNFISRFINDIFSEEITGNLIGGKFSAKRFMGITSGVVAMIGSILAGLSFYHITSHILIPMWTYSGAMLGISILKDFGKSS